MNPTTAEALALARASIEYFQDQHNRGNNRYTHGRLRSAQQDLAALERKHAWLKRSPGNATSVA